jgi:hypothetical protein
VASGRLRGGRLTWGLKSSFVSYVLGPIANGDIAAAGGARRSGDAFTFPVTGGAVSDGAVRVVATGSVRFTGHDHGDGPLLDLTIANPRLTVDAGEATLVVDLRSKRLGASGYLDADGLDFADIAASAGSVDAGGGRLTIRAAAATLTAAGARAFAGYYSAGQRLDPLSVDASLCRTTTASSASSRSSSDATAKPDRRAIKAASPRATPVETPSVAVPELPAPAPTAVASGAPAVAAPPGPGGADLTLWQQSGLVAIGALSIVTAFGLGGLVGRR